MSTPSSSFGALMAMATPMATSTEVKGIAWARQMWPQCNNITIHGPHSPQKPSSAIRMAMMRDMDSYYKAQRYSLITACICLALIAMTLVPGLIKRSRTRYPLRSKRFNDLPWGSHRAVAWLRRFAYRNCTISFRGKVLFSFAGAGHMSVIAAVSAGLISWCFAIQPHYRCTREWGSPPLAIRAGMIANALIPFIFALATKVNFLSLLTSISHQRLQVYHQWMARLVLFFGFVHGIPFLIQPYNDGGSANLHRYFYESGSNSYWTGSVSLAAMVWLVASSTSVFRRMSYEFFVLQHLASIILFLIFYFMHTAAQLSSWKPLWASVALWGAAYFIRWMKSAVASRFFVSMRCQVEVLQLDSTSEGDMVRISFQTPLQWSPGQHVYVRFLSMSPLQSHPFTVVTLPNPDVQHESTVMLMAKVRDGMTRSLFDKANKEGVQNGGNLAISCEDVKQSDLGHVMSEKGDTEESYSEKDDGSALKTKVLSLRASLDGPYGCNASIASFDAAVLVAGGSGFTFVLPVLFDLAWRAREGAEKVRTRTVTVIWSMRTEATLLWMQAQLEAAVYSLETVGIDVRINLHITRAVGNTYQDRLPLTQGRPDIRHGVESEAKKSAAGGAQSQSMVLAVCGPDSMQDEVQHVARDLQTEIIHSRLGNLREVYLLKEAFGW